MPYDIIDESCLTNLSPIETMLTNNVGASGAEWAYII